MLRNIAYAVFRRLCKALEGSELTKYRLVGSVYTRVFMLLRKGGTSLENVSGHKIYLDLNDATCRRMAMFDFEPTTSEALRKFLRPGMVFFDVGAHIGYFTLQGARLVGKTGRVYSFEPEDKNYSFLEKNTKINGYGNIVTTKTAVSNVSGRATMYIGQDTGLHSLKIKSKRKSQVKTVSIDDFCRKENISRIDLVKIDVEGGELDVIEGMRTAAKNNKKIGMIVELNPAVLSESCATAEGLVKMMESVGFRKFFLLGKSDIRPVTAEELSGMESELCNVLAEK